MGGGAGPPANFTAALRMFDAGKEGLWLNKLEMAALNAPQSYGGLTPPPFRIYVTDGRNHILRAVELPGALYKGAHGVWFEVPVPSIQVPKLYGIALEPLNLQPQTEASPNPTSFQWRFGDPPTPLMKMDWAIRPTLADQPATDPKAADLAILANGEAFFDRFIKASAEYARVDFAKHGTMPVSAVALLNLGAAVTPAEELWASVTISRGTVWGKLVSADDQTVVLQVEGQQRKLPRAEVQRISFRTVLVCPWTAANGSFSGSSGASGGGSSRGGSSGSRGNQSGGGY